MVNARPAGVHEMKGQELPQRGLGASMWDLYLLQVYRRCPCSMFHKRSIKDKTLCQLYKESNLGVGKRGMIRGLVLWHGYDHDGWDRDRGIEA